MTKFKLAQVPTKLRISLNFQTINSSIYVVPTELYI